MISEKTVVGIVGLGYVGLPLSIEFGKVFSTIGFDLSEEKINSYLKFMDPTGQVSIEDFKLSKKLIITADANELKLADVIIIAVPTPIDKSKKPDFSSLISACKIVGHQFKKGAIIIFESTVFPGATEEICIPILETTSKLRWKVDFNVGYSPERINPGDKEHTITNIIKIVSGDNNLTLSAVKQLYSFIIEAGVYPASSIKIAEAAKVIENIQRDINIALMNELSMICNKLNIDTLEVIEAAGTKWNFLPFKPGLVGGHCIGVDPYYLTHKAETLNYHPQIILAGRRINDGMAKFVAQETIKKIIKTGKNVGNSRIALLGLTFKENCPDFRNSKAIDLLHELQDYGCEILAHDPMENSEEELSKLGIKITKWNDLTELDAIIGAVSHDYYTKMKIDDLCKNLKKGGVFIDIKSRYDKQILEREGYKVWRL